MTFRVGQPVICICDVIWPNEPGPHVVLGQTYIVSDIFEEKCSDRLGVMRLQTMLLFEELPIVEHPDWTVGYCAKDFRPVVSTSTGMALLESIRRDVSNGVQRKIREDA